MIMFPKCFRVVCQIRVCDTVVISLVSKQQSHPDITSLCLVHNTPALHQRTTEALLSQQHPFSAFVLCLHSKVLHVNCMALRPPPTPPPTPGVINPYAGRSIPHRYTKQGHLFKYFHRLATQSSACHFSLIWA